MSARFGAKIANKIGLGVVVLLLTAVATVATIQYRGSAKHLKELEAARIKLGVEQAADDLAERIAAMHRYVRFIANARPLQALIQSEGIGGADPVVTASSQQWKERLSEVFQGILHANPHYAGAQLIRLGETPRVAVAIGDQTGVDRSFDLDIDHSPLLFELEAMQRWRPGQVYTSDLALMTTGAALARRRIPMIQVGIVVEAANGARFGVVVLSLNLVENFNMLSDSLPDGQKMVLTDSRGSILIRSVASAGPLVREAEAISLPERYPEIGPFLKDPSRRVFSDMVRGAKGEEIAYLTKIDLGPAMPASGLVVGSFSPADRVLAAMRALRSEAILSIGLLAVLGGAVAFAGVHMQLGGLRKLTRAARTLAQGGNFAAIELPPARSDEIGELTQAFDNMIEVISLREAMLRDSEAHFRSIVDGAAVAVLSVDEEGCIEAANPAAARLFAKDHSALIGLKLTRLLALPEPAAGSTPLEAFREQADQGGEVVALREGQEEFPARLRLGEVKLRDRRIYTAVITDLTEQKKIDRMRSEFVSTVSHELRTPLTSIKGALGLMKASVLGELSDEARSMLTIADNNCERLVRLINDILDVEKIEAGKLRFEFAPVDLAELIDRAINENSSYAEGVGVEIVRGNVPDGVEVQADADRLTQVLTNLISNAVKFSPQGETVTISAEVGTESVQVAVTDRGAGIPEEFQKKIFQKFAQADSSDTRKQGGTGLGLSISKLIVEAHGGSIGFETSEGEGTSFSFELPLLGKLAHPSLSGRDSARPKVLICEDDPDIGNLMRVLIEQMNFDAELCQTCAEAKARLAEEDFAAMTLDLGMPDQDGMNLIRELRASAETQDLPVIVVSARSPAGDEELEGDAFRILDWLEKPIDADCFHSALARAVRGAKNGLLRILHVEDDADHVTIISQLVGSAATVDVADTCAKARRLLQAQDYDLVILDLMLPDGPGESLLPLVNGNDGVSPQVLVFSMLEPPEELTTEVDGVLVKSRTSNRKLKEQLERLLTAAHTSREVEVFA